MNTLKFRFLLVFVCFGIFTRCEKDDICISSVVGNPDIVILMLDKEDGTRSIPSGFLIRPIGTEKELSQSSGDSLALPLKISESVTQFEFVINQGAENENIDTIQINYQRKDKFINGACGYRANFILEESPLFILNSVDNWIKGAVIIKDTISDEISAHLGILH
ncbi:DUF6452 family protein [Flavobacteriaceae bacterium]|nr:DUF6452 family protein [Flavobacteriaceae bacterium]